MNKPTLIVITGPTASGKSALAVSLAKVLETEIISADSRQIFKDIPIATAVPSIEERQGIKHHLMEILPVEAYYSAATFKDDAEKCIDNIFKKSSKAIVCGGSMLYIDALIGGIDELPTVPIEIRTNLMQQWKESGDAWLLQQLEKLDPVYYARVDLKNLKRVFHAVEISITASKPYSSLLTRTADMRSPSATLTELPFKVVKFCLNGSRELLFQRINMRVEKMMLSGLEEEAKRVFPKRHLNSLNTVGLKEMFKMFDGIFTKDEAVAKIQKNTRVYAKKQLTWHKRDVDMHYLNFEDKASKNIDIILQSLSL